MSKKNTKGQIEIGTGNVFAQLDLHDPEERLRKARLMRAINAVLKRRGVSRKEAAEMAGLNESDILRIQHGRGARYSEDRLLNILACFGIDVEITRRLGRCGEIVIEVREISGG
jgi:predicted XRE-type DNA-binding protein